MHVAEGSKKKSDGGVNLWGAEGNPLIKSSAQKLESDLSACNKLKKKLISFNLDCHYLHVENVLLRMSRRCEQMCKHLTGAYFVEKKLEKMKDNNPNRKKCFSICTGKNVHP